jgi:hypothetical protein
MWDAAAIAYRYRDPLSLDVIDEASIWAKEQGVFVVPPGLTQHYTMQAPEFRDDPDGANLLPTFHRFSISYPPAFVVSQRDIRLIGYRTFLNSDGSFFNDQAYVESEHLGRYLGYLASNDPFLNEVTGLHRPGGSDAFLLDALGRRSQRIEGNVVVLCSHEPSVYGSFLFRILPKLASTGAVPGGTKFLAHIASGSMRDFLAMGGVPDEDILPHDVNAIYEIEHAIVPSMRNQQGLLEEVSLSFFSRMRIRYGSQNRSLKIYVSRHGGGSMSSSRVMLNEPELIEALKSEGFLIVAPQRLSAREQVEVFSSADLVVGPAGSGIFNVVFCQPGTKLIDIESEPHWLHAHTGLFGSLDLRYGIFEARTTTGSAVPHQPFSVNIEALMARIAKFK